MAVQRRYLNAMRDVLNRERSIGAFSTATYAQAERFLDQQETSLESFRY